MVFLEGSRSYSVIMGGFHPGASGVIYPLRTHIDALRSWPWVRPPSGRLGRAESLQSTQIGKATDYVFWANLNHIISWDSNSFSLLQVSQNGVGCGGRASHAALPLPGQVCKRSGTPSWRAPRTRRTAQVRARAPEKRFEPGPATLSN